jgi:protein SCO1/2
MAYVLGLGALAWGGAQEPDSADPHAAHRAAAQDRRGYKVASAAYDVPDVTLLDAGGRSVPFRDLLGGREPVALNFIFTTCTTICPVMTATFAQMRRELGDDAARIRMVSISIDPEYDRPAVLQRYAARYGAGAGWTFLTGDGADVKSVLDAFGANTGSKMNHRPLTLLRSDPDKAWVRIDGLASGHDLAREARARLLN